MYKNQGNYWRYMYKNQGKFLTKYKNQYKKPTVFKFEVHQANKSFQL